MDYHLTTASASKDAGYCLTLLLILTTLGGCSQGPAAEGPDRRAPQPNPGAATAPAPAKSNAAPTSPAAGVQGTPRENPGAVPPALDELIHTPRATPRERTPASDAPASGATAAAKAGPGQQELESGSEAIAAELVDAFSKGDWNAAQKLLLTDKDLEVVLSPGMYEILRGALPAENENAVRRLLDAFGGKTLTYEWKPGTITTASSAAFREAYPVMRAGVLQVKLEGVVVPVQVDQLVYIAPHWRIFKISTP